MTLEAFTIKDSIKESNENVKNMSKEDFEKTNQDWVHILDDLAKQWKNRASAGSAEVQKIIRRHYEWLKKYWTPNCESYAGIGEGYTSADSNG
ncbi:TipAS antibiotic-recognition domain [Candidatus Rhabdochlamydia oedothoracis]|uniref:TipAS antibiotic-recognition domain n=1 Tax=Candidatus Rhabdochlamydia oedothoracis TaxID=2720720 RepID=A0ABX8V125_9BACT|nr:MULTISPECIES: TipAS antibiotic-recognition domain-containing protein [Rhabdochlamydia]KAG6559140.1 hypothetical protein RHOW815_000852 [Candidatus Rhabdochlamydia sp. W815]MCL6756392.1 TipAS antibiotic-recognition domain-containing protein [Candidatus Rhabdochlamydia oedothoracis]QYF48876.1 TipAS antibiotic-recognition domain [Candidatus Rhabdochlamydia oedothoracis]